MKLILLLGLSVLGMLPLWNNEIKANSQNEDIPARSSESRCQETFDPETFGGLKLTKSESEIENKVYKCDAIHLESQEIFQLIISQGTQNKFRTWSKYGNEENFETVTKSDLWEKVTQPAESMIELKAFGDCLETIEELHDEAGNVVSTENIIFSVEQRIHIHMNLTGESRLSISSDHIMHEEGSEPYPLNEKLPKDKKFEEFNCKAY